jgi:hypothetical protein
MSKRKQALRSLSANECGAVSAQPTEPIRAQHFYYCLSRGRSAFQKIKFGKFESRNTKQQILLKFQKILV